MDGLKTEIENIGPKEMRALAELLTGPLKDFDATANECRRRMLDVLIDLHDARKARDTLLARVAELDARVAEVEQHNDHLTNLCNMRMGKLTKLEAENVALRQAAPAWCFDMDKAPTDGTKICLGGPGWVTAGSFNGQEWFEINVDETDHYGEPCAPVAWMPLPPAPETAHPVSAEAEHG